MKIFVTVGSTRFDSLFYEVAKALTEKDEAIFQIADGEYSNPNITTFSFVKNIMKYYKDADLVITHAGAGSVYSLLEMGKKIIVVQNIERLDPHQRDLANFIERNNLGLSCYNVESVPSKIKEASSFVPTQYNKEVFMRTKEICHSFNLL